MKTLRILLAMLASLFAFAPIVPTPTFAQTAIQDQREITVYVTNTGQRYHRASCRYLRYSSHPMNVADALAAGYTPCHVCRPPVPSR